MLYPNGPHLGFTVFPQLLCGRHEQSWHLSLTSLGIHTNSAFLRLAARRSGDSANTYGRMHTDCKPNLRKQEALVYDPCHLKSVGINVSVDLASQVSLFDSKPRHDSGCGLEL